MSIEHSLFVYIRNGIVVVELLEDAQVYEDDPEFEHIATLEPRSYIEHMLNDDSEALNNLRA